MYACEEMQELTKADRQWRNCVNKNSHEYFT